MVEKETSTQKSNYTVHVVPHTHWDREWYLSYQHFRIRLVRLIDRLIYLLEEKQYPNYHFDGQTIVLEDYLEIRPEQRGKLAGLIASGRIDVGPWYVMPDESLVGGEALIRNLLMGRQVARSFGRGIDVGYLPDIFGHISQMPQILRGFGIDNIVFWRGINGESTQLKSELYWSGADGSSVLAIRLPYHAGYSNVLDLPKDRQALIQRVREELLVVETNATTSQLLFMNGTDHTMPEEALPQLLEWMNEAIDHCEFKASTVNEYMESVKRELGEMAVVKGELRSTNYAKEGHHNFLLPNVLSSRMYLKLMNEQAQTELIRWAEPFSAWASRMGYEYPQGLLRQSWRYLLQNHPHDSICGCSIDEVHKDNETRFGWSMEISKQLAYEAMHCMAQQIDTTGIQDGGLPLHVFNALPWKSGGMVEAQVLFPADAEWRSLKLVGPEGKLLSSVVLEHRTRAVSRHAYDSHPQVPYWQEAIVKFYVEDIPAMG